MTPRKLAMATLLLALSNSSMAQVYGYAVNSDDAIDAFQLLRVDLETGDYEFIGPTGYIDIEGLAFLDQDRLYAIDDATRTLLLIDTNTGAATPVDGRRSNLRLGDIGVPGFAGLDFGLSFDCQGRLWASSDTQGLLWELDRDSGRSLRTIDLGVLITGLAARWDGLYGLGAAGHEGIYRIDVESGETTFIVGFDGLEFSDGGLDFDANGVLWAIPEFTPLRAAGSPSPIYRVDVDAGTMALRAHTRSGIEGLAIAPPPCRGRGSVPAPVDVPSTSVLAQALMSGLLALVGAMILRRRQPQLTRKG